MYANTSGLENTAIGYQALYANTTGSGNTAIGKGTLYANTTGFGNTAIGIGAGVDQISGNFNTFIGVGANPSIGGLTNATAIGYGAVVTASNTIQLGSSNVTDIYAQGNLHVTGTLTKLTGSFKIDHPLDPKNKYLYHSFVESPDMMNIYNGNVVTDAKGYATVELPAWFEALNRDFRYQLTVIDEADGAGFVQAKVVRGVNGNHFTLRTSVPATKVSWQVTGIRQDAYAEAHRIQVEENKPAKEKGTCMYEEACTGK